eukprot:symbB.v1.2.004360.t1/scaffold240.1/size264318/16
MFSEGISLEQLRRELSEFAKERDWDLFRACYTLLTNSMHPETLHLRWLARLGSCVSASNGKGRLKKGFRDGATNIGLLCGRR